MSTPVEIADHVSRRRRRRTYLVLGIVLMLLCLSAGWFLGQRSSPAPQEQAQPEPSPDPGGGLHGAEFVPLGGESEAEGSYPVNFPHTAEGAVSAAFHGVKAQSTNDLSALTDVMNTYYLGDYDQRYAQTEILDKRELELGLRAPEGQEFDDESFPAASSYYYIAPIGIYWDVRGSDAVEVCLLSDINASDGDGIVYRDRDVLCHAMAWSQERDGDWMVEEIIPFSVEYRPLPEEYDLEHETWTPISDSQVQGG